MDYTTQKKLVLFDKLRDEIYFLREEYREDLKKLEANKQADDAGAIAAYKLLDEKLTDILHAYCKDNYVPEELKRKWEKEINGFYIGDII